MSLHDIEVWAGTQKWYYKFIVFSVEKNGNWTHYNLKVKFMNYFRWLLLGCFIGICLFWFLAGQWVINTQFQLFCFGK